MLRIEIEIFNRNIQLRGLVWYVEGFGVGVAGHSCEEFQFQGLTHAPFSDVIST